MSEQIANIHDAFFKQALSDPMLADTFLREHLPPEVAALLGPEPPEPMPGSFVDEELRQHHSDLLFRVRLTDSGGAFAYVLIEHKSSRDPGARLQLLRYVVRVLTQWYERNNKQLPLPPVLPLLVHQGPKGWSASCEFAELFGAAPEALRPYLPSFRHALVDLSSLDDHALSAKVRLRAFLKALKYRTRRDINERIVFVLAEAPLLAGKDLSAILIYLETRPTRLRNTVVQKALEQLLPERKERILGPITEPYYKKGLAEGEARGEAKVLARLLQRRFGEVPASFQERIFGADVGAIEAWLERAFDAPDLQAVFEST
jgi:predicted transposase/invertase (TIGR01784 family)